MKFLWRLASGSGALWVQVVRAKYLLRSELWLSKRTTRCTQFWRALMRLRETLLPWLTWKLGDGQRCNALAQPWFQGALSCTSQQNSICSTKVGELVSQESGTWDAARLVQLFGYVNTMHII